jgi:glycosyltransferase involved in cell wall biosynthesis
LEAIPKVIKDFPNIKFVLIGEDEGMYDLLMGQAKKFGIEQNLMFLGALSDDDVSGAFYDCSLFVLPSEFEAFGIVLIEAMAARKPTVATRVGGIPYVVAEGRTTNLVEYGDSQKLAEAICDLLADEKKGKSYGEAGRSLVLENYAIDSVVSRLETVYKELLNNTEDSGT